MMVVVVVVVVVIVVVVVLRNSSPDSPQTEQTPFHGFLEEQQNKTPASHNSEPQIFPLADVDDDDVVVDDGDDDDPFSNSQLIDQNFSLSLSDINNSQSN